MKLALALGFLTFTLLALTLVWLRAKMELTASRLADVEQEALEEGIGGD